MILGITRWGIKLILHFPNPVKRPGLGVLLLKGSEFMKQKMSVVLLILTLSLLITGCVSTFINTDHYQDFMFDQKVDYDANGIDRSREELSEYGLDNDFLNIIFASGASTVRVVGRSYFEVIAPHPNWVLPCRFAKHANVVINDTESFINYNEAAYIINYRCDACGGVGQDILYIRY